MKGKQYKYVHRFFLISVLIKGINGTLEIIGGLILLVFYGDRIDRFVELMTQSPAHTAPSYVSPQLFASFFLLSHGIIKIFLIVNLLQRKLWAYPSAIIIFGLFTIYQAYRFVVTYSPWMLLLTIFDLIVIVLTYLEYRRLKAHAR